MMLYRLARPFLFALDAETAHELTLPSFRLAQRLGLPGLPGRPIPGAPVRAMGLEFPNPVGLAAGLDKNGEYVDALAAFGFGFIEVGTVTPRPQDGQARPRVFRLPAAAALINRMGFPNDGVARVAERLRKRNYRGIVGVNIGKNADTPLARAVDDYVACLEQLHAVADYIAVNVSSPNTAGLRELQDADRLAPMLTALVERRAAIERKSSRHVPLLVKLAPDLTDPALAACTRMIQQSGIDGVIASNSTVSRPQVAGLPQADEPGGLSGAPLHPLSLHVVRQLRTRLGPRFPIIGVGGIDSAQSALGMREAGADLVQVYTALVYEGPRLVTDLRRALAPPQAMPVAAAG
jgi:dihydroorotate dehydrogenase